MKHRLMFSSAFCNATSYFIRTRTSAFCFSSCAKAICALALTAAPTFAGIKYWDNGAYDADSYIQDGLVLNYDGIRNAGLGQPHSDSALDWVNIGANSPAKNLEWSSHGHGSLTASRRQSTHGAWTGNGFHFDGGACWIKWNNSNPVSIPANYTMQFAMTASPADQDGDDTIGYIFFPHTSFDWKKGSVAMRKTAHPSGFTPAGATYAVDEERLGTTDTRPCFVDASPKYANVVSDSASLSVFEGTVPPSAGDQGRASITGTSAARSMNVIALGGNYNKVGQTIGQFQGFTGTLHAYRLYSRVLENEELAWNRVVDEKRFFGAQLPIPATNAVIRSNLRLVSGAEPVGCYAVDASGYAFVAPATTVVSGRTYTLVSATKETWNAASGAWSAAEEVAVDAANGASVAVSSSELVRISWKWRESAGIHTAADYTIDDIVTDGLVLHYDGILNDGWGKGHSDSSLYWQNLAEGYSDWPLVRVDYTDDNGDGNYEAVRSLYYSTHAGEWSQNGFVFDGYGCMMKWNDSGDHRFVLYPEYTFQFTMTAAAADQSMSSDGISYLFLPRNDAANGDWTGGSISIRSTAAPSIGIPADSILTTDSLRYGSTNIRPSFSNPNPRFANVVADSSAVRVFDGVKWPTSGNSYKEGALSTSRISNWFAIGGQYNPLNGKSIENFQAFHGTLHSIRYYDRPLEAWELKRNRNVDSVRFFGELGVTNLVVEVEEDSGIVATPAPGAFAVDGEYTFTATGGDALVGRLWDLDETTGAWTNPRTINGGSYAYDEATATATTQKLRWSKVKAFILVVR